MSLFKYLILTLGGIEISIQVSLNTNVSEDNFPWNSFDIFNALKINLNIFLSEYSSSNLSVSSWLNSLNLLKWISIDGGTEIPTINLFVLKPAFSINGNTSNTSFT